MATLHVDIASNPCTYKPPPPSACFAPAGMVSAGGLIQRFYSTCGQPKRYFLVEEDGRIPYRNTMSTIFFREADGPYEQSGGFWHVEFYPFDTPLFPVGLAVVCSPLSLCGGAQLNFLFVADQWRRQGIAEKLVAAC